MSKIDIKVIVLKGSNWEDVLNFLGRYLYESGYVKETYVRALVERERSYPTGLEVPGGVNIAIPHADMDHVIRDALIIGVLENEVLFHKMDEPDKQVAVRLVMLPVIKDPKGYVKFLSKLISIIQERELIDLVNRHRYGEIARLIEEKIFLATGT